MPISHVPLRDAHNEGHTDVCFTDDGQKYITCGSEGDVRIWSQDLYEDPIHECVGEWALAIRHRGDKLYVATGNNDVVMVDFPIGKIDTVFKKFVAPINNIAVSKQSDLMVLASEDMQLKLIPFEDKEKVSIFEGFSGPCLGVAVCPKSQLVAGSGGDGKLFIWNIEDKSLIKEIFCFPKVNSFSNAKILCRIDFDPINGSQLAYPDGSNVVILNTSDWTKLTTLSHSDVTEPYSIVQYSPCGKYLAASSIKGDFVIWDVENEIVNNFTKHPNNARVCAFHWNPSGMNQIVYTDVEGQLGLMSDCINKPESIAENGDEENNEVDFGDIEFEDEDEDNENAISLEKLKKQFDDDTEPELKSLASRSPTPRPRTPVKPSQEAFMPSSTPTYLDPRYLCWNEVGVIRGYGNLVEDDESSSKSIEVDFHDSTLHSSMMMQNYQNYSMGSLSTSVLIVANASQINVIPLAARTKEWTLNVDNREDIVAVAASDQLICIAQSNYIVRVCSSYGTQRAIFTIPGPIVCMAAFKEDILVAYHSGPVRKEDQCISFKLVRLEGINLQGQDLGSTLGPQSNLQWMGFSDCGSPAVMDSLGMLYMYPLNSTTWIPFCDTSKHHKGLLDTFFVTAVLESNQSLCGIKCRDKVYPAVVPRPTMCEIPLEAPFAEMSTEKSQMESSLFTWSTLQIPDTEKKIKETALKTFALACKNNLDQRAQEVMEILGNTQILTLAIKYASRLDKKRLAEKLTDLAARLTETDDEDHITSEVSTPEVRPVSRRLTLSSKSTPKNEALNILGVNKITEGKNSENIEPTASSVDVSINSSINIDTQESLCLSESAKKNPFSKSLKNTKSVDTNPLSLINSKAGVNYTPENQATKRDKGSEKRKHPDADTEKPKTKERKIDRFMFGKRS